MLGMMSRYAWYAEREVIDCAKFIDNRYYVSELSGGFDRYRVDPSYWVLSGDDIPHVLPSNPSKISCDPEKDIRWDMVETVAGEMATVTMRLRDLRERLKL